MMCHARHGGNGGGGTVCLLRLFLDSRRRLLFRCKPQALPLRKVQGRRMASRVSLSAATRAHRPAGARCQKLWWRPLATVVRASTQGRSGI
eukprot:scaffold11302_cov57-Phaeocystis_antarctica.AAC.1